MKYKKNGELGLLLLIPLIAGVIVFGTPYKAFALSAPTITAPKENSTLGPGDQLKVSGLVQNDSSVFVFVDGRLVGGVKTKNGKKGTGSFTFQNKKALSFGNHSFTVQAIKGSEKSEYTQPISFSIPKVWPRRLDGVIVDAAKARLQPVAVMIENLAQIRPQNGLASASIVYEALAEGGVPRFLAIFAHDNVPKIGPVRSARPYYVDWAKEYGATLLHAGGSRDALNEFGRLKLRSIDALVSKTARYFSRAGKIASTHNLFTSGKQLQALRKDYKIDAALAAFQAWKFKDDPALAKRPNEKRQLVIDFKSGKQYIVGYRYDRPTNSYLRDNGGKPHLDANYPKPAQIKVKNVVVQLIEKEKILDRQKHLGLQITGSGRGWLLQDGKLHQILWKKPKADSRTVFYFLNNKEVEFNRGNIWIEVVPKDRPVLYK